ncbi:espin-like isoform X2 [Clytia hemisphaerica]|uniref:Uncharacterized protein n=1 Tax=Clytia hemisphaerica TaxID=252671 RepID=A0A7M5WSA8_9CNID
MSEQALRTIQEAYSNGTLRPNVLDQRGLSLLHYAAFDGQLLCVKCLINYGADIHARSREGFVAAHYAAAGGHLPILQFLYERDKTSVTVRNEFDLTPLYVAAQEGQLDCLIWLNKYTRTVRYSTSVEKMNAALVAAQEGRLDCLRYLVRVERELVKAKDRNGFNVIHYAASEGHSRVLKWLIDHCNIPGGAQSKMGQTALHLAAIGGHASSIEILIKCGVSLEIEDDHGKTALDYSTNSNQECKELLQKKLSLLCDGDAEKKVRFDESVQLHETFPSHHHATSFDNKNTRRKRSTGIFWDADLQAEFDSWRNSPKLSNNRKQMVERREPYLLNRGQSKVIRNLLKQNRTPTSTNSSLSRASTAPTTPITPLEKPDLLKHINDQFAEAARKEKRKKENAQPPPVPARNNGRKNKYKKFKVTDQNIQNSLRKYHSIDIGQAMQELEKDNKSSVDRKFEELNASTPKESNKSDKSSLFPATPLIDEKQFDRLISSTPNDSSVLDKSSLSPATPLMVDRRFEELTKAMNLSNASTPTDQICELHSHLSPQSFAPSFASTPTTTDNLYDRLSDIDSHRRSPMSFTSEDRRAISEPFSFLNLEEPPAGPPTPPVRTNTGSRLKHDLKNKDQNNNFEELRKVERQKSSVSQHSLRPERSDSGKSKTRKSDQVERGPSFKRSISPMLQNLRYKDMGDDTPEEIYQPSTFLAQSNKNSSFGKLDRVRSFSADHLVSDDEVFKPFTDYLDEKGLDQVDFKVPSISSDNSKTLFTRKKKRLPALLRGVTSFISSVRSKKEDPYEIYFSSSSTNLPPFDINNIPKQQRKTLLNNVTLPRASRKGFDMDELFESKPIDGVYRTHSIERHHGTPTPSPPQSGYKNKNNVKHNPANIEFNRMDQSLRGTSQYVKEIEKQQAKDYLPVHDGREDALPLAGRMRTNSNSRKERVNAIIW